MNRAREMARLRSTLVGAEVVDAWADESAARGSPDATRSRSLTRTPYRTRSRSRTKSRGESPSGSTGKRYNRLRSQAWKPGSSAEEEDDDDDEEEEHPYARSYKRTSRSRTRKKSSPSSSMGESKASSQQGTGNTPVKPGEPKTTQKPGATIVPLTPETFEECTVDRFCWACHKADSSLPCAACPRTFHLDCVGRAGESPAAWYCPECIAELRNDQMENRSWAMRQISVTQLGSMLKFAVKEMQQRVKGSELFSRPVSTVDHPSYRHFVLRPTDLSTLAKRVDSLSYGSPAGFLADVKWVLHNSMVFNGSSSSITGIARRMIGICASQMDEIETCPECYMRAHTLDNWFTGVCSSPHLLVWAKSGRYPYWPAKLVKAREGELDCRFFGAHEKALLVPNFVYLYSPLPPTGPLKASGQLAAAIEECDEYISNLQKRHGRFRLGGNRIQVDPVRLPEYLAAQLPELRDRSPLPAKAVKPPASPASPSPKPLSPVRKMSDQQRLDALHRELMLDAPDLQLEDSDDESSREKQPFAKSDADPESKTPSRFDLRPSAMSPVVQLTDCGPAVKSPQIKPVDIKTLMPSLAADARKPFLVRRVVQKTPQNVIYAIQAAASSPAPGQGRLLGNVAGSRGKSMSANVSTVTTPTLPGSDHIYTLVRSVPASASPPELAPVAVPTLVYDDSRGPPGSATAATKMLLVSAATMNQLISVTTASASGGGSVKTITLCKPSPSTTAASPMRPVSATTAQPLTVVPLKAPVKNISVLTAVPIKPLVVTPVGKPAVVTATSGKAAVTTVVSSKPVVMAAVSVPTAVKPVALFQTKSHSAGASPSRPVSVMTTNAAKPPVPISSKPAAVTATKATTATTLPANPVQPAKDKSPPSVAGGDGKASIASPLIRKVTIVNGSISALPSVRMPTFETVYLNPPPKGACPAGSDADPLMPAKMPAATVVRVKPEPAEDEGAGVPLGDGAGPVSGTLRKKEAEAMAAAGKDSASSDKAGSKTKLVYYNSTETFETALKRVTDTKPAKGKPAAEFTILSKEEYERGQKRKPQPERASGADSGTETTNKRRRTEFDPTRPLQLVQQLPPGVKVSPLPRTGQAWVTTGSDGGTFKAIRILGTQNSPKVASTSASVPASSAPVPIAPAPRGTSLLTSSQRSSPSPAMAPTRHSLPVPPVKAVSKLQGVSVTARKSISAPRTEPVSRAIESASQPAARVTTQHAQEAVSTASSKQPPINKDIADLGAKAFAEFYERFLGTAAAGGCAEAQLKEAQLQLERSRWTHGEQLAEQRSLHILLLNERANSFREQLKAYADKVERLERDKERLEREKERVEQDKVSAVLETKRKQWCAGCLREAKFHCCWNTSYCAKPCQLIHWTQHNVVCKNQQAVRGRNRLARSSTPASAPSPSPSLIRPSQSQDSVASSPAAPADLEEGELRPHDAINRRTALENAARVIDMVASATHGSGDEEAALPLGFLPLAADDDSRATGEDSGDGENDSSVLDGRDTEGHSDDVESCTQDEASMPDVEQYLHDMDEDSRDGDAGELAEESADRAGGAQDPDGVRAAPVAEDVGGRTGEEVVGRPPQVPLDKDGENGLEMECDGDDSDVDVVEVTEDASVANSEGSGEVNGRAADYCREAAADADSSLQSVRVVSVYSLDGGNDFMEGNLWPQTSEANGDELEPGTQDAGLSRLEEVLLAAGKEGATKARAEADNAD